MNTDARGLGTSLVALVAALTVATGCGDDPCAHVVCASSACVPPFDLGVTDGSTGQPVANAQATSPGLTCTVEVPGVVSCPVGTAQATYAVEVSAAGYATKQVQVVVRPLPSPDRCGCQTACQAWDPHAVTLAPSP